MRDHELLFSESNSRFLLTTGKASKVLRTLRDCRVPAFVVGRVGGGSLRIILQHHRLRFSLDAMRIAYKTSLQRKLEPWVG